MRAKKSKILMAVAGLLLGVSGVQAQTEVILFKLTSLAAVHNNPSQRTMFRLDQPAFITKMFTYHWNNGRGAGAGRIGLRNAATGQMVGMWNAVGTQHMFDLTPGAAWPSWGDGPPMLHWAVQPNVNVPPGTYEIVDSDPGTWASNAEMGNRGCAWVFGIYGGGGYGQIAPSPVATPQVNPQPTDGGMTTINVAGPWTSSDDSFGGFAISQSGSNVNMHYPKRKGRVIGQLRGNVFDGYWIQDFSGRRCSNSQDNSFFWGRLILTFNGDSYTGNWGYCDEAPGTGLHGNRAGGGLGQIVPSPVATPQVQPMPTGALSVSINPPQQTINSGEKAVTTANVAGGTPPYTCAWYNGTRQSQVVRGGVNWTMRSAGTRDIKVVVTDSAGNSAEAHAQILVQEAGGGQVMPSPPATPEVQPTPTPMPASVDVNGMWRSGNQNFIFYQEGQTIKVIDAYRNGSQLVVWYGEGWIHGNQVHYRLHHSRNTVPDDGDDIHEFTVSADGNTMTGAWNVLAGPPHGGWTLQRVGP